MQSKLPKIRYVGGWVSLSLFLLMCLCHIQHDSRSMLKSRMEVNYFRPGGYMLTYSMMDTLMIEDTSWFIAPKRNYKKIELDDNNELEFKEIENFLLGLKETKDTTIGIDISFSEKSKYKDMVEVFNQFLKTDTQHYFVTIEHIYAFELPLKKKSYFIDCMQYWSVIDNRTNYQKFYDLYLAEIVNFRQNYLIIFGAWLFLGFLSLRKILNRRKGFQPVKIRRIFSNPTKEN